jgi:hypothetical protein
VALLASGERLIAHSLFGVNFFFVAAYFFLAAVVAVSGAVVVGEAACTPGPLARQTIRYGLRTFFSEQLV